MRSVTMTLLGVALVARAAAADVIHVPADHPTIQAAINAAVDGDEVVIAPGTYNEAINFSGKAITVRGEDGPDVTSINATGLNMSVVRFVTGEGPNSILRDLTITGGRAPEGGGIYASSASPTIVNCRVVDNESFGVVSTPSGPSIASGGGLHGSGMTVKDCLFTDNTATGNIASGGGATTSGSLFVDCTFINNRAQGIGWAGTLGNATAGGISAGGSLLINCAFLMNQAAGLTASGGGIVGGNTIANCVVAGNTLSQPMGASGSGAGMNTGASVINCTIANNVVTNPSASTVGGVNGNALLANCIVVGNTSGEISSSAVAHHCCIEGIFPGKGNLNTDPLFVDPINGDYHLQDGSPCRDVGSNDALPPDTYDIDGDGNTIEQLSLDVDRLRRKVNGIVDMGAHEWQRTCEPDIAPSSPGVAGDGVVDVDDLVTVILGWGTCDQCVADINGDDVVDVDDLVLIILNWGRCP